MMKENEIEQKLCLLDTLQSPCTQCGICLQACATYQTTGWEYESPRGRVLLAKAFLDGKIQPTSTALETFDRCLGCRACESSCPEGVQFQAMRNLVQDLQVALDPTQAPNSKEEYWIKLAWRIGSWRWRSYAWNWLKGVPKCEGSYLYKHSKQSASSMTLMVGCVQDLYHHKLIKQTVEFLNKLDIDVHLQAHQTCCGAIFERLAKFEQAKLYQAKRKNQFHSSVQGSVCFLSQNCQQYHPSLQTIDLYQLIIEQIEKKQIKLNLKKPLEVYYQPYCGQKNRDFALELLNRIDGLTLKTLWPVKSCCGGCGGESMINPEQANAIAEKRLQNIPKEAILVVTSFDCWMQYQRFRKVMYPVQLCQGYC